MKLPTSNIERHLWNELRCGADSDRALAAMQLASLLRNRGDLEAAHELLSAAAAVTDPTTGARAWLALAEFLAEIGEASKSLRAYRRAAELANPHRCPDVVIDLAGRAEENGNQRGAAALYEAVIAADPEPALAAVAYVRVAGVYRDQGRDDLATVSLRSAKSLATADLLPAIELELAELLLSVNQRKPSVEAESLLSSVIASDHPDLAPRAALLLAEHLAANESFARAYELVQAVIQSRHPDLAGAAEDQLSALMHRELEHELLRPKAAPETAEHRPDPSGIYFENGMAIIRGAEAFRPASGSGRKVPPQRDGHRAECELLFSGLHSRFLATPVVRNECGLHTWTVAFNCYLDREIEAVPRLALVRSTLDIGAGGPAVPVSRLRRVLSGIRRLLVGSPHGAVPAVEGIHGYRVGKSVDLGEACLEAPIDVGTLLAHGLITGAVVNGMRGLMLGLVDYRRDERSGLIELDWLDPALIGSSKLTSQTWPLIERSCISSHDGRHVCEGCGGSDRLSVLASEKWEPLRCFEYDDLHRKRAETAVEAAISAPLDALLLPDSAGR